jgi:hypothetical protein
LTAYARRIEVDLDLETRAAIGTELCPRGTGVDADRLDHANVAALLGQLLDAGLLERVDEGTRTSVEDRHLAAVDLDRRIVDAEAEQRSHQVFDRRDMLTRRTSDHGAEVGRADLGDQRANLVSALHMEDNPGIGVGGADMRNDRPAAVNAHAGQGNRRFQSGLTIVQINPLESPSTLSAVAA